MPTYYYYSWDNSINSWSVFTVDYCLVTSNDQCIQRQRVSSLTKTDIKELWVSVLRNASVFVMVVGVLLSIVFFTIKRLFRWKKHY